MLPGLIYLVVIRPSGCHRFFPESFSPMETETNPRKRGLTWTLSIQPLLSGPDIEDGDGDHRDDEVDEGVGEHEVDTADVVLGERNAAPGGLQQWLIVEDEVVDLGVLGPGGGRHEADQPDLQDGLLGFSSAWPRLGRQWMADCHVSREYRRCIIKLWYHEIKSDNPAAKNRKIVTSQQ